MIEKVETVERVEGEAVEPTPQRSRSQEAANREEAFLAESTRRFEQKRSRQKAQAWYEHHDLQLASHEATFGHLVAYHREERARYAAVLGIAVPEPERDDGPPPEAA